MKRLFLFVQLVVATVLSANAQTFVFVDMEYIMKNIPAYEQAENQLQTLSQKYQKEVEAKNAEAQNLYKEYQNNVNSLSASQKTQKEEQIVAKEKESAELRKKYFAQDGELAKQQEALISPIQDKVYEAIKAVALEQGYDVVVDRASAQSVIFATPDIDISNEILARMGYSN